ncbi:FtsW/RodA/SpoVE family cell cycle protein [Miniphocaeibacter massiliensis]|uniref:FtsW/RodA/SpoVE family cell cycle protein n=1 Tax=Miniphocaeibacter massiliensis TaxID=2041841 RepID=UPI0013ECC48A|nr:FtsW/RodA/SpoVE family cell cycle protein [Miniphocaeibacter massiliensis]
MSKSKVKNKAKKKISLKERFMKIGSKGLDKKLKNPSRLLFWFQILTISLVLVSSGKNFTTKSLLAFIIYMAVVNFSNRIISKITTGDNYLMLIASMLFSIGIIMIYRINSGEGIKQIIWYMGGTVLFYIVYYILKSFRGWENLTVLYAAGCFAMFAITILFGTYKNGANNWIRIGGFSFQLSEISKILFVFFTASFQVNTKFLSKFKYRNYVYMIVSYILIGMFFIQKDLGSAVIFYAIYIISLFVFNYDKKIIIANILLAMIGAIIAYFMFEHIQTRVTIWLDPWGDPGRKGYQIIQSLFAIAAGDFFGTGLRLGRPDLIPIATSDFIFPAIVEEMGIFTGMGIIMLFMILVYRGFKIAMEQQNYFFKFVAMGISILFATQAIVMIGGVLKLIPMTGITIPFLSYGGSSMISSFICLGILQYSSSDTRGKMVD